MPRKRGRPPRGVPLRNLTVVVPEQLYAEVHLLLLDPTHLTGQVKSGAWSGLIEKLLGEWLDAQRRTTANAVVPLPPLADNQHVAPGCIPFPVPTQET